ncbi:MAG: DUF4185 domain-containing protein [Prevotellaceae bacterium]|jgi:hypothetical protein|nr:DUF4185 domain-containing protein [Prevotellaceae bacterium]
MKTQSAITLVIALLIVACSLATGCKSGSEEVVLDDEIVNILFPNRRNVLTGGDGAISIKVNEKESYWVWGDCFIGEVNDDNTRDMNSPLIVGNVWQLVSEKDAKTIHGGTADNPKSIIEIDSVDGYYAFLWPMHGFVKNGIVHAFMSVIVRNGEEIFDFYWHSSRYYRLKYPELTIIDGEEMKPASQSGVHYGFGFFEKDGYCYTYGSAPRGYEGSPIHVARARVVEDKLQSWEFFNGSSWGVNPLETKALEGVDIPVSEQFSIFPYKGKFILVAQDRFKPDIYTYIADSPEGPWYNKKFIYNEPEAKDTTLFLYNAMAHPQYDRNGRLLVCYSVNTWNIPDLYSDVSIYRPRFIRVPYSLILE